MIYNLLTSIRLLTDSCRCFTSFAVEGLTLNRRKISAHLHATLMLVTAITPVVGYDKAAEVAQKAHDEHKTLLEVVVEEGLMTGEEYQEAVNVMHMAKPYEVNK